MCPYKKPSATVLTGSVGITTADPWYSRDTSLWEGPLPWYAMPQAHLGGGMVTDRFIYIGMPNTGSGAAHRWLPYIEGLQVFHPIAGHQPYAFSVNRCNQAGWKVPPAFVFARNPWEWNVACFCAIRARNRKWFSGTWEDFLEYQRYARHWGLPDLNISGVSAVWEYIGANNATYFGKVENYADDWVTILGKLIPDLITEKEIRAHVTRIGHQDFWMPPDGELKPYQEFYTSAQRDLVMTLEKDLIERFEYTFDDVGRNYH